MLELALVDFIAILKTKYEGSMVKLRPLETEGVAYKAIGLSVPLTIGFPFLHIVKKASFLDGKLNWRTTFTDYLDDIFSRMGRPLQKMTDLGAALSDRTDELDPALFEDSFFK
jgi:hypothetical protein